MKRRMYAMEVRAELVEEDLWMVFRGEKESRGVANAGQRVELIVWFARVPETEKARADILQALKMEKLRRQRDVPYDELDCAADPEDMGAAAHALIEKGIIYYDKETHLSPINRKRD